MLQNRSMSPTDPARYDASATPEPHGGRPLDRRKMLTAMALSPVVSALASCGDDSPARRAEPRGTAVVVGAGLCGLRALELLRERGWDARLIEAAERPGGRVLTLRDGLPQGLWAEAGAERVRPGHRRVLDLLRRFGIPTLPYPRPQEPYLLEHGGRQVRFRAQEDLPQDLLAGLSESERRGFPGSSHLELARAAGAPDAEDRRTAWAWLKASGMTPAGEPWVRAWAPWPLDRLPARTFHRFAMAELAGREGTVTVSGGMDRLTTSLAAAHEDRITYGARVTGVDVRATGAVVATANGTTYEADWVILALPIPALQKLPLGLAGEELRPEIARHKVENEIKLHLEVPGSAFSATSGSPITMRTRFPRVTWPGPVQGRDGLRVINMMAVNEDVPTVRGAAKGGEAALRRLLESSMPVVARAARRVLWHDFSSDPLAGGAWTWTADGAAPSGAPLRSERLVIAGSDLSADAGWMEGALASAEAAVEALS